ncbi:MAG: winged helix-turn-helix domain-containing protein [Candidatus Nanohaloarchaea archaeon]
MDEAVLFYLSQGGDVRLKILRLIQEANEEGEGMYLNKLAEELDMSHVGARNHLELLLDNGYVEYRNPDGKPKYLKLTDEGERVLEEG